MSTSKYQFTPAMQEISGFGGGYEETCRRMLAAALTWLDEHPEADPKFAGYKDVYGVISDENDDAKALSKAAVDASGGDCTGAMHQAIISSAMWIREHGWDKYVEQMTHKDGEVGLLKERVEQLSKDLDNARKQRDAAQEEANRRGAIIAEKVLNWALYPVSANSQQKVYAPDAETAKKLMPGDLLMRFVNEAIKKMVH